MAGNLSVPHKCTAKFLSWTGCGRVASFNSIWKFTGPGAMISTAYMNTGSIEASVESGAVAQFQVSVFLTSARTLH